MKLLTIITACALALGLSAETINFDLSKIKDKKAAVDGNVLTYTGGGILQLPSVKFDPTAKYTLSMEVKMADGAKTARFYAGYFCDDSQKRRLAYYNIDAVLNSDTVLTADVKKGDKVIMVKNGSAWRKAGFVAFNTKTDYSDLPNFEAFGAVTNVKKDGDVWAVTLSRPIMKAYPAGTAVREQMPGGYLYTFYDIPKKTWKKYTRTISGVFTPGKGKRPDSKFWPKTATIKPMVLVNWSSKDPDTKTQFRNITLTIEK